MVPVLFLPDLPLRRFSVDHDDRHATVVVVSKKRCDSNGGYIIATAAGRSALFAVSSPSPPSPFKQCVRTHRRRAARLVGTKNVLLCLPSGFYFEVRHVTLTLVVI